MNIKEERERQARTVKDLAAKAKPWTAAGENHGRAKLTEADVREIRRIYTPGCRVTGGRALARKYGLTQAAMQRVITGRAWKHLEEENESCPQNS